MPDTIVYQQPWVHNGDVWASQHDTGIFGRFATVYDNFTLGSTLNLTGVGWTGGYFNPSSQGTITGWRIQLWNDDGGNPSQPTTAFYTVDIPGTGSETFLGNAPDQNGVLNPMYSYFVPIAVQVLGGTKYWISMVPDLLFPPQWGWGFGTGGDGISWQDYFGARSEHLNDQAFTLYSNQAPPPPPGGETCGPSLALQRADAYELDNGFLNWQRIVGLPLAYNESDLPTVTVEIAPAPSDAGVLDILYTPLPATFDGTGIVTTVPDDMTIPVLWGALSDLLSQDGEGNDPKRAEYCRMRYDLGVELCRILLRSNLAT